MSTTHQITQEKLSAAVTAVLPGILEKLRVHYDPPAPLDDFERNVMGYTDERSLREHIEHRDRFVMGELQMQASGGLAQSLYKSEDAFKAHLVAWVTADRTGCSPLSYGNLNYLLANALIDELGIRGEITQKMARPGSTRTP